MNKSTDFSFNDNEKKETMLGKKKEETRGIVR